MLRSINQIKSFFSSLNRFFTVSLHGKMTRFEEIEQLHAFARVDGVLIAGLWILSFACFVGNFVNPLFAMGAFGFGAFSLIFAALRLKQFRDNIREGRISFRQALGYSLLQYLHAALLFAAAQFVYFQFIDHGFLMAHYTSMMNTPEFLEAMKIYGLKEEDITLVMQNMGAMRPIDNALQFFTTNVFIGAFISLPVAILMRRKPGSRQFYKKQ